jgi:signal transduction histidine kinase
MNLLQAVGGRLLNNRWAATAFALLLLVASLFLAWQSERSAAQDRLRQVEVQAQILAGSVSAALAFNDREATREYLAALRLNRAIQAAAVYGSDGRLVDAYVTDGGSLPEAVERAQQPRISGGKLSVAVPVEQQGLALGHVYVRAAIESWTARASRYVAIGIIIVLAALLIVLLGATNAAAAAANERLRAEIAAREQAEAALRQSQKMEAMGQLTGGVAHDFNNLLSAASSGLDLLERAEDPGRRAKLYTGMREVFERGAKLTQQLLAFARRVPLQPEVTDVGERLAGMRNLLERSLHGGISLDFDLEPRLWPVEIDASQFDVAVLNCVVNARDAMEDGGAIRICARNAPGGFDGRDAIEVAIEDNGSGMSAEVLERVFEPFFTTKEVGRGTGLGLSQVYGFAQASNGAATVSSIEGVGTTLTLFLPRCEDAAI